MAFKVLTRGGIYLLFIVGAGASWLYKRMRTHKEQDAEKIAADIALAIANPVANLSSSKWRIRIAAIHALTENPNAENIPLLAMSLSDAVYDVREAASSALIAHGEDAVNHTIEVLEIGNLEAREIAVQVLAAQSTSTANAALARALLEDESAWVRIPAAEALGNSGDISLIATLIQALNDNHEDVYHAVVAALKKLGTDDALEAIRSHPYQPEDKKKKSSQEDDFLELS